MHIEPHLRSIFSSKLISALMLSLSIFAVCSCKKAPSTGEAFVTLNSDEIRPLGDLEVSFYESDFGRKLKDFQSPILSGAKIRAAGPFEEVASKVADEIKSAETHLNSIDEKAQKIAEVETILAEGNLRLKLSNRESDLNRALEVLENKKHLLINKKKSLKAFLASNESKYTSLFSTLEPRLKKEKELIKKAHDMGDMFYANISKLIKKINETIAAEGIATNRMVDPAGRCRNTIMSVRPRSAHLIASKEPNLIKANLFSITFDDFWKRYGGDIVVFHVMQSQSHGDGFKLGRRKNGWGNDVVCAANFSALLEKTLVAGDIIKAELQQESFCKNVLQINKDLELNNQLLIEDLIGWINENNTNIGGAKFHINYEKNLREFEAIPKQVKAFEQKQAEALKEAKSDIAKIKEEVALFEGNIVDYQKKCYEKEREQMLSEAASEMNELKAKLQEANTTIEKIKSATSLSDLCSVDGVGRDVIDSGAAISKIRKFLKETKNSSTRTGSDGKFKVPADARYAMAYHYRESTKNELFWLIKIDLEEDQVRLSNSNITNTHERGESDSVWDFLRSDSGKSLLEVMEVSFDDE